MIPTIQWKSFQCHFATICLVSSTPHFWGICTNPKLKTSPITPWAHKLKYLRFQTLVDSSAKSLKRVPEATNSFKILSNCLFFLFKIAQYDLHVINFVLRHFRIYLNNTLTNEFNFCECPYFRAIICRQAGNYFKQRLFPTYPIIVDCFSVFIFFKSCSKDVRGSVIDFNSSGSFTKILCVCEIDSEQNEHCEVNSLIFFIKFPYFCYSFHIK